MQKSRSSSASFNVPGTWLEPGVAAKAREMAVPGYYDSRLAGATEGAEEAMRLARALAGGQGEDELFRQSRERIMPGLAARGLATSAQGIRGEYEASEAVYNRRMQGNQLLQQASQGLAMLRMMPEEMRAKIMAMLLGQTFGFGESKGKGFGIFSSGGGEKEKTTSGGGS